MPRVIQIESEEIEVTCPDCSKTWKETIEVEIYEPSLELKITKN